MSTPQDELDPLGENAAETLAGFKDSFFYGSRSNLDLKFLARLTAAEAGDFLADVLGAVSELLDDGAVGPIIDRFIEWQRVAYQPREDERRFSYDDGPFARPRKPLRESRVALVTSSGHFVEGDDPEPFGIPDMTQAEAEERIGEFLRAEPTLSVIPTDTAPTALRVRHGGYPVEAARADHQVALPIGHLASLQADGVIGELSERAYSFVGATSQLRLRDHVAPRWAEMLRDDEVDVVLLVPV